VYSTDSARTVTVAGNTFRSQASNDMTFVDVSGGTATVGGNQFHLECLADWLYLPDLIRIPKLPADH